MKVSPIAPALWIAGMFSLFAQLFDILMETGFLNPIITIIFFLLTQELSKFVAEMTMVEENGEDNN